MSRLLSFYDAWKEADKEETLDATPVAEDTKDAKQLDKASEEPNTATNTDPYNKIYDDEEPDLMKGCADEEEDDISDYSLKKNEGCDSR